MGGRLQGKIAIITGAAQGMGAEHARVFVAAGAQVMLTDLQEAAGAALAAELGASARFMRHDISSADDWDAVIAATRAAFGPANVLLNNAGMYFIGPVDEADPETRRDVLQGLSRLKRMRAALHLARPGDHRQRQRVAEPDVACRNHRSG